MQRFNWLIITTTILMMLGVIADLTGVLGINVDNQITVRWLLLEVIVSAGIILVLAQLILTMKQKLDERGNSDQELIAQLKQEIKNLEIKITSIIFERELLQAAILVIDTDREQQFTDPEMAYLGAISSAMQQEKDTLSEEDRFKIIDMIIKLSCADRDFRKNQQEAVILIGRRFGLDYNRVSAMINTEISRLNRTNRP